MPDINVESDLEQVNQQLEQFVNQLNQLNTQRDQLTQQIHNLNGIAMYLRGKKGDSEDGTALIVEDNNLVRTNEYPTEV
jgi:peptidoglycan hydrolase CwlO-like protein